MKRLLVAGLVFLVSCSKQTDEQQAVAPIQKTDVQTCDFGMRNFNLSKRAPLSDDQTNFIEKPPRGGGSGNTIGL
jgi:PBP1b-binding outer membrane lipoprotein LpoB